MDHSSQRMASARYLVLDTRADLALVSGRRSRGGVVRLEGTFRYPPRSLIKDEMRRETSTTEVCGLRVRSAGSEICEIAKEPVNAIQKSARSLQNLHRGFDSRRRLSCSANRRTPITHGRGSPDHCRATGALEADFIWRLARAAQKSAGKRQRSARQRSAVCVTSELRGMQRSHDRGRGPSRGGAERWAADSRSAVLGSDD
jgi:hypothetical protein